MTRRRRILICRRLNRLLVPIIILDRSTDGGASWQLVWQVANDITAPGPIYQTLSSEVGSRKPSRWDSRR